MSSDEDYYPDETELSDEDIAGSNIVIENNFELKEILHPDDSVIETVEEYELHEEAIMEEMPVNQEDTPLMKTIRGNHFNENERIALEFCVDEMLTYSKTLSKELDDKIPMNWESVAQRMQDAGYDRNSKQTNNHLYNIPRRESISQKDNAIYERLLRKLKEQMDEHEAKHKIVPKIEVSDIKKSRNIQIISKAEDDISEAGVMEDYIVDEIEEEDGPDPEEKIKCQFCHVFVKRKDMFDHQSVHRNDAPYKCKECGKTFRKKYPLKLHRRVHTTDKPFTCDICGMLFKADGSLKRHMKRHLGEEEKRYQCEFCETKWLSPYDLNAHRRTHTGEKPFLCHDCGVSFAKVSNLNAHQRRHQNIRNYKCEECERAFMSSTELENHKVSHTGIKKYKCDLCGRAFGTNEALSRHKARHPGLLNLVHCPICNRRFRSEKGLQAHMNFGTCTEFKCPKCHLTFKSLNGLTAHHKRSKCMIDLETETIIEEEEVDEPTQLLVVTDFMD